MVWESRINKGENKTMSEDVFENDGTECLVLKVNGRDQNVNKGTITDLKSFIGGKAKEAGVTKYRVYIDGEKVLVNSINNYEVSKIEMIEVKTYDKVAV